MKFNKIIKLITLAICATSAVFAMDSGKQTKNNNNSLQIMTFNIRRKGEEAKLERKWDNRKAAVITMLKDQKPAVLGLQEATEDQIADLKKALTNYDEFGEGRGRVWYIDTNESTPIFYDKNKLDKLKNSTFSLTPGLSASKWNPIWRLWKRYKRTPEWGSLPRICTYGLFKNKQTQKQFYVFNTHLEHQLNNVRIEQLRLLLNKINQLVKDKTPVILMGDFNANITGEIGKLLQQNGFINTTKNPTITQRGWSGTEKKIIDHILIKNDESVNVQQHIVLEPKKGIIWSDHYPVEVNLKFTDKKDQLTNSVVEK